MTELINVGIFGGCNSTPLTPELKVNLIKIAESLSIDKMKVIYGGGHTGIMHVIPQKFNERGGKVKSINSHALMNSDDYDKFYGEHEIYDTLDIRQSKLIENSDIFVCLPGGIGTFFELFHVMALNHTKIRNSLIILYNYEHYFDALIELIKQLPKYPSNLIIVDNYSKVIQSINNYIENLK